jgi:hypothetical protein
MKASTLTEVSFNGSEGVDLDGRSIYLGTF